MGTIGGDSERQSGRSKEKIIGDNLVHNRADWIKTIHGEVGALRETGSEVI